MQSVDADNPETEVKMKALVRSQYVKKEEKTFKK